MYEVTSYTRSVYECEGGQRGGGWEVGGAKDGRCEAYICAKKTVVKEGRKGGEALVPTQRGNIPNGDVRLEGSEGIFQTVTSDWRAAREYS
jgi:hypothetical protein